jgi:hypothetical protein
VPIKVSFGGDTWMTDDLTLDEMVVVEEDTGATWVRFNPFLSSKHARAALIAFLARSIGRDEATRKVGALSIKEAIDCFEVVAEDDLPDVYENGLPKAEGEPATTGSSGAPNDSDGPLT